MSEVFKGVITKLPTKPTKTGGKIQFMALGDFFCNVGFFGKNGENPPFVPNEGLRPGVEVEFSYEKGNWGNVVKSNIEVVGGGAGNAGSSSSVGSTGSSGSAVHSSYGQMTEKDKKTQESIHWQTSRRDAIDVVKFMVEREIVKMPAKVADRYGVFLEYVDDVAGRFFEVSQSGPSEVEEEEPDA